MTSKENESDGSEWRVPDGAGKQLKLQVRPGDDYPLVIQVVHKEDALATQAGLTIEQAAMLHHQLGEFLDEIEDPPNVRTRAVESKEGSGREFQ